MVNIKILKINMIPVVLRWMVDIKKLKKKYLNGFDINGKHKDTKNEYDPNGFDINGKHKDTNIFEILMVLIYITHIKILMIYTILMGLI